MISNGSEKCQMVLNYFFSPLLANLDTLPKIKNKTFCANL